MGCSVDDAVASPGLESGVESVEWARGVTRYEGMGVGRGLGMRSWRVLR